MKWNTWESLHQDLRDCDWFAHVGEPVAVTSSIQTVELWTNAHTWAIAEISWWCVNEASNVLRSQLSANHRMEYRKWNEHIKAFARQRDELVDAAAARLPEDLQRVTKIADWIRSHFTRAFLECIYSPLADIHLVSDQVEWYLTGRFPCGWMVKDEVSFPEKAVAIIY